MKWMWTSFYWQDTLPFERRVWKPAHSYGKIRYTQNNTPPNLLHALHRGGDGYWISSLADLAGVENIVWIEHLLDTAHQFNSLLPQ